MKKILAIALALSLVLCVAAASALVNGKFEANGDGTHTMYTNIGKDTASETDLPCVFVCDKTETKTTGYDYSSDANTHVEYQTITSTGHCRDCMAPMTVVDYKVVAKPHTLFRGAYVRQDKVEKCIAHSDTMHLDAYDIYVSACTVCGWSGEEKVAHYAEHNFRTKNPIGWEVGGEAKYGKGSYCKDCEYTRAYKDLTTAAGKKLEAIIAAYEAAGKTVEFDADQMIAVGIEEGEVAEVEGCGVATIMFTNWSPIAKKNINAVQTDLDSAVVSKIDVDTVVTQKIGTDGQLYIDKIEDKTQVGSFTNDHEFGAIKEDGQYTAEIYHKTWSYAEDSEDCDEDLVLGDNVHINNKIVAGKKQNLTQDSKCYEAAFVTMYVDGEAHRVYFYERHDGNGWVYAFEADMADGEVKLADGEYNKYGEFVKYPVSKAYYVRCGAGQEYAPVGSYSAGKVLTTIGTAYATEGYNTTWKWAMLGDFEFVAAGK